jgi:hypothetical protein
MLKKISDPMEAKGTTLLSKTRSGPLAGVGLLAGNLLWNARSDLYHPPAMPGDKNRRIPQIIGISFMIFYKISGEIAPVFSLGFSSGILRGRNQPATPVMAGLLLSARYLSLKVVLCQRPGWG